MRIIKAISEDEMISTFLKAEINSERFGHHILDRLRRDNKSRVIIDNPNLENTHDNQYRKQLLGEYRGYGNNKLLFKGFPTNVKWQRIALNHDDLKKIKYINYDYWVELSQKTRIANNAVKTIENGEEIFSESNQRFIDAAGAIKEGIPFPEMILVSTEPNKDIVVIEGHLRLTAYLLANDHSPEVIEAIIGYSPDFINWALY